jgi:hypothetical protein
MPIASSGALDTLQAAAAATGDGTPTSMDGVRALVVDISGTFSATVTFEGTVDDSTWFAVEMLPLAGTQTAVTTATAPGQWTPRCQTLALSQFRARVSAFTSGAVTAVARKDHR